MNLSYEPAVVNEGYESENHDGDYADLVTEQ